MNGGDLTEEPALVIIVQGDEDLRIYKNNQWPISAYIVMISTSTFVLFLLSVIWFQFFLNVMLLRRYLKKIKKKK